MPTSDLLVVPTVRSAMAQVERWCGDKEPGRPWLGPAPFDSYGSPSNRVTVWVLQGSPARGVVIQFASGDALAISMHGRRRKLFRKDP